MHKEALDKTEHLLILKFKKKTGIEGNLYNVIKDIDQKLIANIKL